MIDVYYEPTNMWQISSGSVSDGIELIDSYGTIRDTTLHWHHALELVLILEGSVEYTANCVTRKSEAGGIHLINSQTIHQAVNCDPRGRIFALVLLITDEFLSQLLPALTPCSFAIPYGTETENLLRQDMYAIAELEQENNDALNSVLIKSHLLHIIYLLFRDCRTTEQPHSSSGEYSRAAIRYVSEHYAEPLSLDQIAAAVGLQKNYFCRCFKQDTGLTFAQYLNQVRLSVALSLMNKGNARMLDCALQAGFSSEKIMIDWCRKIYHTTPRQYIRSLSEMP